MNQPQLNVTDHCKVCKLHSDRALETAPKIHQFSPAPAPGSSCNYQKVGVTAIQLSEFPRKPLNLAGPWKWAQADSLRG